MPTLRVLGIVLAARGTVSAAVIARPNPVAQGDVMVVVASAMPAHATFGDQEVHFFAWRGQPRALVGVDVETPAGARKLVLHWDHGPAETQQVRIRTKRFPQERLTVAPEYVEPPPAAMERIRAEQQRLEQLWRSASVAPLWSDAFHRPIDTPLASAFGLQRVFNGQPRSPHPGVDFRAEMGLPVHAANSATVALAEELYFTGNTVILDHGVGLYTVYGHLREVAVHSGQEVERGALIGYVGATGRATGPHLHWGARLQAARVDPLELVALRLNEEGHGRDQ